MKMPSPRQHFFSLTPQADIPRSSFNRSHSHKTTLNAGWLVPFYWDIALPGDTANVKLNAFGRLSTPIRPVMDNMYLETFFFAVPFRLFWPNFQKHMGEQLNPGDSTDYLVPTMTAPVGGYVQPANWASPTISELAGSLSDYFGIPTQVAGLVHDSYLHQAYNLVWNEHFRDENLQTRAVVALTDGPHTYTDYVLRRRGKRHDYFTSCLPWPQKGTAISLPLGVTAPVKSTGVSPTFTGSTYTNASLYTANRSGYANVELNVSPSTPGTGNLVFGATTGLYTDLTAATAATINQLRQAFQIQKLYERDARGGTRYTEVIHAHFAVVSPDARLQRPEYLGGGSTYINFTPIAQNSQTGTTPQGNLAAMATASITGSHGFVKSFTEHCVIIGLVNIRSDMTYQYGLHRHLSIQTRLDWYWPALSHIGEQAVLNKEIYAQGTAADNQAFGYQERSGEYRYKPGKITGRFRSNYAAGTLDSWHLAQKFISLPVLGDTFIQENPPVDRIVAVPTEPHFLLDTFFEEHWARPMPVYSIPGLMDHF